MLLFLIVIALVPITGILPLLMSSLGLKLNMFKVEEFAPILETARSSAYLGWQ